MADDEIVMTVGELRALIAKLDTMIVAARGAISGRPDDERLPPLKEAMLGPESLPPKRIECWLQVD